MHSLLNMLFFSYIMLDLFYMFFFFFSSRRRHTRFDCDWSSDVCSSDLGLCARPIKMMTGDDATVEDQLEVIDRHDGPQRYVVRQCRRLDQCNVIPRKIGRASCRGRV